MDKLLLFPGKSEKGVFTYVIDAELPHLTKTAAEYHPHIAQYIRTAAAIPGKTQILLTALGAGEWWGCNVNGDYFPEGALAHPGDDFGHKTFETTAKIYKHHINKDPKASYGDVRLAVYNDRYHRVELIVILDNAKAPDIVERINNGDYPEWSMGCRVPYDVCSICANKARTSKEYCEHLKYYMGRIHPATGKQAYAINTRPKFFDISQVLIGADKIAKTLLKVAATADKPAISSAVLAEKMAVADKAATITKEIPAGDPPASQESIDTLVNSIPEVKASERPLPTEVLDRLGRFNLSDTMSTLSMLGILPKPQEFQRIILISIGKKPMADQLDKHGMCFDPMMVPEAKTAHLKLLDISADRFRPEICSVVEPYMSERSYMASHLGPRLIAMEKSAATYELPTFIKWGSEDERKPVSIIPLMALAAGLYAALGQKAGPAAATGLDKLIIQHPGLAAALAISAPMIFNSVVGPKRTGQYDAMEPRSSDRVDIAQRIEEMRQKPYTKTATQLGPASKRLFLGIPAVYMASGVLQKQRHMNPHDQEGRAKRFIRQNPDLIGAALAVDALAGERGTHGLLKNVAPKAESAFKRGLSTLGKVAEESLKTASAHDFISNSLIWPLAAGGANLPAKVMGGLFDQAVLEVSKKVLSNKKQGTKINNVN